MQRCNQTSSHRIFTNLAFVCKGWAYNSRVWGRGRGGASLRSQPSTCARKRAKEGLTWGGHIEWGTTSPGAAKTPMNVCQSYQHSTLQASAHGGQQQLSCLFHRMYMHFTFQHIPPYHLTPSQASVQRTYYVAWAAPARAASRFGGTRPRERRP